MQMHTPPDMSDNTPTFYAGVKNLAGNTNMQRWFNLAFLGFIVAQFLISSNFVYTWLFYLGVSPPACLIIKRKLAGSHLILKDMLARLILALFVYTIIHSCFIWQEPQDILDTVRHTIATSLFVLCVALWFGSKPDFLTWRYKLLLWMVILSGSAAIIWHMTHYGTAVRLEAFGQNDHAILGANVFIAISLLGFYLLHPSHPQYRPALKYRLLPYSAFAVTGVLIILTQSRGPLLSFIFCSYIGLLLTRHNRTIIIGTLGAVLCGADFLSYWQQGQHILPLDTLYDALIQLFSRESHRLNIWRIAVDLITEKPWTGYGMQVGFPYGFGGVNPHNIFLSAWYYTGITGFALLLGITGYALVRAFRCYGSAAGATGICLICHAVLACMTDTGQYVNSPSPLWIIFWLPVGYVIALQYRNAADSSYKNYIV